MTKRQAGDLHPSGFVAGVVPTGFSSGLLEGLLAGLVVRNLLGLGEVSGVLGVYSAPVGGAGSLQNSDIDLVAEARLLEGDNMEPCQPAAEDVDLFDYEFNLCDRMWVE